jgi:diguanylate cyclase (GGDEF)-like protein
MAEIRFDAFILALGLAIAGMLLAGQRRALVPFSLALPAWAAAIVTLCVGVALIGLGDHLANPWPTLVGKVLVAGAHAVFLYAIVRATGQRPSALVLALLLAPVALVFLLSAAIVVVSPLAPLRSGLLSLLMVGYAVTAALLLALDLRRGSAPTVVALIVAFAVAGASHLVRGVIVVDFPEVQDALPTLPHDLLLVATLAMIAASVAFALTASNRIQDEYLALAHRDELTGLSNRRAFNRLARRLFERARFEHGRLAALVIDIDHFKRINDRLGHAEGDQVLVRVAGAISSAVDPGDAIARVGGEEFCALLPGAGHHEAIATAERIRAVLRNHPVGPAGMPVTVSIGVAELLPLDRSIEHLIERADTALLTAKVSGRDRVVVAEPADSRGANVTPIARRPRGT